MEQESPATLGNSGKCLSLPFPHPKWRHQSLPQGTAMRTGDHRARILTDVQSVGACVSPRLYGKGVLQKGHPWTTPSLLHHSLGLGWEEKRKQLGNRA